MHQPRDQLVSFEPLRSPHPLRWSRCAPPAPHSCGWRRPPARTQHGEAQAGRQHTRVPGHLCICIGSAPSTLPSRQHSRHKQRHSTGAATAHQRRSRAQQGKSREPHLVYVAQQQVCQDLPARRLHSIKPRAVRQPQRRDARRLARVVVRHSAGLRGAREQQQQWAAAAELGGRRVACCLDRTGAALMLATGAAAGPGGRRQWRREPKLPDGRPCGPIATSIGNIKPHTAHLRAGSLLHRLPKRTVARRAAPPLACARQVC